GVYVKDKTTIGFTVQEFAGGASAAPFDWMMIGYKKGFEPKDVPEVIPVEPILPEESTQIQPLLIEDISTTTIESVSSADPVVEEMIVVEPVVEFEEVGDFSTTTLMEDDEAGTIPL
ncbi:MAG TPA: hypothetical protein DDW36_01770, partial [Candidatus Magasanikbacteria bacterium]|nr:hypothetical protein [Candidatus Magasanikbacteria bacterium]